MVWVASRSTGEQHRVLGVFGSLDQAEQYVEQQAIGRSVAWTPADRASRAWHYTDGHVVYEIERYDLPDRAREAGGRSWRLRCYDCEADWTVTPARILAGDDWIVCPRCGGGGAQTAES